MPQPCVSGAATATKVRATCSREPERPDIRFRMEKRDQVGRILTPSRIRSPNMSDRPDRILRLGLPLYQSLRLHH